MRQEITHIIGAGLSGLSAAASLTGSGRRVVVYEAGNQAGGRCRSYYDPAFGGVIDNGNHLLLSGNKAALSYLRRISAENGFMHPDAFYFTDAPSGRRFALYPGLGLLWMVIKHRHLWHPLAHSALNASLDEASVKLLAAVLRKTFLRGKNACMPLVAHRLSATFIDPAVRYLTERGRILLFNHHLQRIECAEGRAVALHFSGGSSIGIGRKDDIILAVPPWNIASIMPGISAPNQWRSILNAHFRIAPPGDFPEITGVLKGTVEWIFAFPDRISITISDAGHLMQEDREALARRLWQEISGITGLPGALPPWQIVKEKRATFAATPEQNKKRPGAATTWPNLYLAGDWVQTRLPATIEGAILSGEHAANFILAKR